ncbi:hypothetical protein CC80DRAFT_32847 [Byssothecium circinans]|uniref:Uncharacterized protein n=1 Tax=Byssothecium circinans TaxID=147558 RepID=A0A6A5TZG2_9PLEO|nr:hypothetical protein CC80DRAFT_32847 [Byssothecium circinans]
MYLEIPHFLKSIGVHNAQCIKTVVMGTPFIDRNGPPIIRRKALPGGKESTEWGRAPPSVGKKPNVLRVGWDSGRHLAAYVGHTLDILATQTSVTHLQIYVHPGFEYNHAEVPVALGLERTESQQWMEVPGSNASIWPILKTFLHKHRQIEVAMGWTEYGPSSSLQLMPGYLRMMTNQARHVRKLQQELGLWDVRTLGTLHLYVGTFSTMEARAGHSEDALEDLRFLFQGQKLV